MSNKRDDIGLLIVIIKVLLNLLIREVESLVKRLERPRAVTHVAVFSFEEARSPG